MHYGALSRCGCAARRVCLRWRSRYSSALRPTSLGRTCCQETHVGSSSKSAGKTSRLVGPIVGHRRTPRGRSRLRRCHCREVAHRLRPPRRCRWRRSVRPYLRLLRPRAMNWHPCRLSGARRPGGIATALTICDTVLASVHRRRMTAHHRPPRQPRRHRRPRERRHTSRLGR